MRGKWIWLSGIRSSGRIRSKHSWRSALAKLKGKSSEASRPSIGPFVHAPEMAMPQVQIQLVDQPCHQRQLLGGADRAANAGRPLGRGLPPGSDVFQGLGQIKLFERVVELDCKTLAGERAQVVGRKPRGVVQNLAIERRVVPPIRRNFAERSHSPPPPQKKRRGSGVAFPSLPPCFFGGSRGLFMPWETTGKAGIYLAPPGLDCRLAID